MVTLTAEPAAGNRFPPTSVAPPMVPTFAGFSSSAQLTGIGDDTGRANQIHSSAPEANGMVTFCSVSTTSFVPAATAVPSMVGREPDAFP